MSTTTSSSMEEDGPAGRLASDSEDPSLEGLQTSTPSRQRHWTGLRDSDTESVDDDLPRSIRISPAAAKVPLMERPAAGNNSSDQLQRFMAAQLAALEAGTKTPSPSTGSSTLVEDAVPMPSAGRRWKGKERADDHAAAGEGLSTPVPSQKGSPKLADCIDRHLTPAAIASVDHAEALSTPAPSRGASTARTPGTARARASPSVAQTPTVDEILPPSITGSTQSAKERIQDAFERYIHGPDGALVMSAARRARIPNSSPGGARSMQALISSDLAFYTSSLPEPTPFPDTLQTPGRKAGEKDDLERKKLHSVLRRIGRSSTAGAVGETPRTERRVRRQRYSSATPSAPPIGMHRTRQESYDADRERAAGSGASSSEEGESEMEDERHQPRKLVLERREEATPRPPSSANVSAASVDANYTARRRAVPPTVERSHVRFAMASSSDEDSSEEEVEKETSRTLKTPLSRTLLPTKAAPTQLAAANSDVDNVDLPPLPPPAASSSSDPGSSPERSRDTPRFSAFRRKSTDAAPTARKQPLTGAWDPRGISVVSAPGLESEENDTSEVDGPGRLPPMARRESTSSAASVSPGRRLLRTEATQPSSFSPRVVSELASRSATTEIETTPEEYSEWRESSRAAKSSLSPMRRLMERTLDEIDAEPAPWEESEDEWDASRRRYSGEGTRELILPLEESDMPPAPTATSRLDERTIASAQRSLSASKAPPRSPAPAPVTPTRSRTSSSGSPCSAKRPSTFLRESANAVKREAAATPPKPVATPLSTKSTLKKESPDSIRRRQLAARGLNALVAPKGELDSVGLRQSPITSLASLLQSPKREVVKQQEVTVLDTLKQEGQRRRLSWPASLARPVQAPAMERKPDAGLDEDQEMEEEDSLDSLVLSRQPAEVAMARKVYLGLAVLQSIFVLVTLRFINSRTFDLYRTSYLDPAYPALSYLPYHTSLDLLPETLALFSPGRERPQAGALAALLGSLDFLGGLPLVQLWLRSLVGSMPTEWVASRIPI